MIYKKPFSVCKKKKISIEPNKKKCIYDHFYIKMRCLLLRFSISRSKDKHTINGIKDNAAFPFFHPSDTLSVLEPQTN